MFEFWNLKIQKFVYNNFGRHFFTLKILEKEIFCIFFKSVLNFDLLEIFRKYLGNRSWKNRDLSFRNFLKIFMIFK